MKKLLVMALAMVLMLCMVTSASAAVTLEKMAEYTNKASWLRGTDLITEMTFDGTWAGGTWLHTLSTVSGEAVSDTVYLNSVQTAYYDYVVVGVNKEGLNYTGLITNTGAEVIPCNYGDIDVNEHWAIAFEIEPAEEADHDYRNLFDDSKFYKITKADVYALPEGKLMATLDRQDYANAWAYGEYLNILDRNGVTTTYDASYTAIGNPPAVMSTTYVKFDYPYVEDEESGLGAVEDAEGNLLTEAIFDSYDRVDMIEGYGEVTQEDGDAVGLIDEKGNLVLPCLYEDIETMMSLPQTAQRKENSGEHFGGYACVVKDEMVAYASLNSGETTEFKYNEDDVMVNGLSFVVENEDDSYTIVACDGTETQVSNTDEDLYAVEYTAGRLYKLEGSEDEENVLIDMYGNTVLTYGKSDSVYASGSGDYLIVSQEDSEDNTIYVLYKVNYDAE